jgi:hypothetical protein
MDTKLNLEAPWEQVKEMLKEINYELTDGDLDYEPGHEPALLERLGRKMNKTPDEVRVWIESVSHNKVKAS